MHTDDVSTLDHVLTELVYTESTPEPIHIRVFPPSSGRPI